MITHDRYELSQLTLDALRDYAELLGIDGYEELDQDGLISAIVSYATSNMPLPSSATWTRRRASRRTEPEPAPVAAPIELREPTDVFIDRGLPIPESYPGTRLRLLVRDPLTLFVYWETRRESEEGWEIRALGADGELLLTFRSPLKRSGSGYLHFPPERVARLLLLPVQGGQALEPEIDADLSEVRVEPPTEMVERWVDWRDTARIVAPPEYVAPSHLFPSAAALRQAAEYETSQGRTWGHHPASLDVPPSSWSLPSSWSQPSSGNVPKRGEE
ncbi:MAG: hypothetical protein RBU37_12805 [Myxococcota bacterium]|nr:hypothetical protein [Myxococcota bacterium]